MRFLVSVYRTTFAATARGEQQRPLLPRGGPVDRVPPAHCQPQARSPAKPRRKEAADRVIRKSCQKALRKCTINFGCQNRYWRSAFRLHAFFLLQQTQGFVGDKRWSRFWGCLGGHIIQWLGCRGRGDRMAYYGASWAFLWRKPQAFSLVSQTRDTAQVDTESWEGRA